MGSLPFGIIAALLLAPAIREEQTAPELLPQPKDFEPILPKPTPTEPKRAEQVLPPPLPLVEMGPLGPVLPGYFHPDPNAHWNLYGVNQQGMLVPRVLVGPSPYYVLKYYGPRGWPPPR
jgi:hypothetical protein